MFLFDPDLHSTFHTVGDVVSWALNLLAAYLLNRRIRRENVDAREREQQRKDLRALQDWKIELETERKTERRIRHEHDRSETD